LARTIGDLRIALAAMSQQDMRDPWWVPAPLEGPPMPRRAALCLRPDGLETVPEVVDALKDAALRLQCAGWTVEEVANTPPLNEAAELQRKFWLGDGFEAMLAAAEKEGDPGALACLRGSRDKVYPLDVAGLSTIVQRRAALTRAWQLFLQDYPVLVMPVSGELPFEDQLDLKDDASFARVWRAQMPQVGLPFMGLPGLTVTTGLVGGVPVGVQVVAGRYREDLCLLAGEAIEAGGTPASPVDPAG
jgi:amidase